MNDPFATRIPPSNPSAPSTAANPLDPIEPREPTPWAPSGSETGPDHGRGHAPAHWPFAGGAEGAASADGEGYRRLVEPAGQGWSTVVDQRELPRTGGHRSSARGGRNERGFSETRPIRVTRTMIAALAIMAVSVGALVLGVLDGGGDETTSDAIGATTGAPLDSSVGLPTQVGAAGAAADAIGGAAVDPGTGAVSAAVPEATDPGAAGAAPPDGADGDSAGGVATPADPLPSAGADPGAPSLGSGDGGLATIGSGTYIVGTEIQPGQYRVAGSFVRLDASMDVIEADGVYEEGEMTIMQIAATDTFVEIRGEAMEVGAFRQTIGGAYPVVELGVRGGTYLVGEDIAPGRYRVEDPSYAWATRLTCDREFVDHQGNEGSVISIIEATDCLFSFSGTLTRLD